MATPLPESVQEIADVIGRRNALYLIGQLPSCVAGKPGKRSRRPILYVPKALKPSHRLVQILGWETACQLVEAFPGEILQPANCAVVYRTFRDKSIRRMLREGATAQQVAELLSIPETIVLAAK